MAMTPVLLFAPRAETKSARRSLVALACCLAMSPAMANERAELDQLRATTLALIQALVDQGLISSERAQALVRQAGPRTPAAPPAAPAAAANEWGRPPINAAVAPSNGTVRVPYLSETTKAQIKEEVKNDVLATAREEGWADARQLPSWLKTFDFEGDLRVRYDTAFLPSTNTPAELYRSQVDSPAWSPDLTNTQNDRSRLTVRARFGFTADLSDEFTAAIRVGTGNAPTSRSQTLGTSPGFFSGYTIYLDRAWLRWRPVNDLELWAGRMPSPFRLPDSYLASDLLWPDDVSLDGVALTYKHNLGSAIYGFFNAGAFVLQELSNSSDKWLYAGQVGVDMWPTDRTQLRLSAALYDFQNIEGVRETEPPPTGPAVGTTGYYASEYPFGVRQKGNTLIRLNDPTNNGSPVWGLASQFRPVILSAALRFNQFDQVQFGITADYVNNTAFDLADIQQRGKSPALADLSSKTTGAQLRFQVGSKVTNVTGAWDAYFGFRSFERDAWVDALTDTTWNAGGTNYRGYSIGGAYTVGKGTTLGLRWTSTKNLDDGQRFLSDPTDPTSTTGNLSSAPLKVDVLQIEVQTKF